MSTSQGEKLRLIRFSEQLNKQQLVDLVGVNYTTYLGYESDKSRMTLDSAIKIFGHPRFHKYQDWFMHDRIDPSRGQIAPALAHNGPGSMQSDPSEKQIG
ncbi:XRE family transcriptional regulator [Salmonella enterica subsp. enterica serovar Florida]|uniref:XRE family transcriptional regulator n=1 Tax=Salmonella enterica subsp. enterica serovar Panama TaxID=29472 RepID=A0A5U8J5M5_SALET|nr:helix-turn-helix transcriptional regulator [Salmonella enterica]EBR7994402.1 XRE family transcriptional regulator [Salmonella enterica subsp. enterica serovar Panama]EBW8393601.1 XRE family transcriptional regulator [Salmonella enterica subsp. enterica serovar Florida]ASD86800.1 transcriptional regulator [Salmonella enterica subsp. enterica serovar India str. SA20085604]EBR8432894.1 XRE family transcriptional regulator [Salmonella enterica subsp. enterica serovar Panama]EBW9459725.1 XRE fam